ncbi:MAG: SurA N-terminal domain-containing protein [Terriglobales bacterium]
MAHALCLAVVMLALVITSAGQQVVDRIVATVNGQPILLSDWEVEIRFEALLDNKSLPVSGDDARAALDRLIDHELLREQFKTYRLSEPSADEVDQRAADLRKQIGASDDAAFQSLLTKYGLNKNEFRERVANQAAMLRFIDLRLRPSVHVDRRSIETYYYETLVPELKSKGQKAASLAEVSPQIEELLSQERVNVLTTNWLKDLRQQSNIHIDESVEMPTKPPETGGR